MSNQGLDESGYEFLKLLNFERRARGRRVGGSCYNGRLAMMVEKIKGVELKRQIIVPVKQSRHLLTYQLQWNSKA